MTAMDPVHTCILIWANCRSSNHFTVQPSLPSNVCLQMSLNGQIGGRRVCAPLCRRSLFKYHKKNVFWLQILPLLLFSSFSLPRGVKWSSDIDAPVKTIVRRFQRREIALASLIYVKTRFFPSSAKRRYPKPFSNSSYLFQCRPSPSRRRLGKPIQHVCVCRARATPPST